MKNFNDLKFGTKEGFNRDFSGTDKMALVVWMDRKKLKEIMESKK